MVCTGNNSYISNSTSSLVPNTFVSLVVCTGNNFYISTSTSRLVPNTFVTLVVCTGNNSYISTSTSRLVPNIFVSLVVCTGNNFYISTSTSRLVPNTFVSLVVCTGNNFYTSTSTSRWNRRIFDRFLAIISIFGTPTSVIQKIIKKQKKHIQTCRKKLRPHEFDVRSLTWGADQSQARNPIHRVLPQITLPQVRDIYSPPFGIPYGKTLVRPI